MKTLLQRFTTPAPTQMQTNSGRFYEPTFGFVSFFYLFLFLKYFYFYYSYYFKCYFCNTTKISLESQTV